MEEQGQVAFDVAGNKEVLALMLMASLAQPFGKCRIGKKEPNLIGRALHGMGQQPGVLVVNLGKYAALTAFSNRAWKKTRSKAAKVTPAVTKRSAENSRA